MDCIKRVFKYKYRGLVTRDTLRQAAPKQQSQVAPFLPRPPC